MVLSHFWSINIFLLESNGTDEGELNLPNLADYDITYRTYTEPENSDTIFSINNEGEGGLEIESREFSDSMYILTINNLEPNEFYQISAFVKVDYLEEQDSEYGVNIGENGSWVSSTQITESRENWERIEVVIRSGEEGIINLNLRIGFWGNHTKGKAIFDDIMIEKITDNSDTKKIIESDCGNIRVVLDRNEYEMSGITEEKAKKWVNTLSLVKDCYKDLVGKHAYNGKIDIITGNYYGAYAIAGDPIQWLGKSQSTELRSIEQDDDWLFGILHEIGHNYDLNDMWNFDAEVLANFKMAYVLEKLNGKVIMNYEYTYVGAEIKQHYKKVYDESGLQEIDGVIYKLIDIKDKITEQTNIDGWDAYKKVFRYFNDLDSKDVPSSDSSGKIKLYLDKLSDYSGINIRDMFSEVEWAQLEDRYGEIEDDDVNREDTEKEEVTEEEKVDDEKEEVKQDNTIAKDKIPNTGLNITTVIMIMGLIINSIILFIGYKIIKRNGV